MAFEGLTDEKIENLINCPKRLTNPNARKKVKYGHEQTNYQVMSIDNETSFQVYTRQNLRSGMQGDFSCGISLVSANGETLTLRRYNGYSHQHKNRIENEKFDFECHIHEAKERYINSNKKADGYAFKTKRYNTLDGAFHCLIEDFQISGIITTPDITNQQKLF